MNAIILAAGCGRRLGLNYPKCLIQINNKPIIHHTIDSLLKNGVKNICIVTGFESFQLMNSLYKYNNMNFVHNENYQKTNTLYSFMLAKDYLNDDCFLINGDLIFESEILKRMINNPLSSMAIDNISPINDESMKVYVNIKNMIYSISKELNINDSYGESVGITLFRKEYGKKFVSQMKHFAENDYGLYYEDLIDYKMNIFDNIRFVPINISPFKAKEIDTTEDMEEAKRIFNE